MSQNNLMCMYFSRTLVELWLDTPFKYSIVGVFEWLVWFAYPLWERKCVILRYSRSETCRLAWQPARVSQSHRTVVGLNENHFYGSHVFNASFLIFSYCYCSFPIVEVDLCIFLYILYVKDLIFWRCF